MDKKTILIIDDNEDILYTLCEICNFQDWNALTASSYKEAEAHFDNKSIDLIIIDYHMPETDGITAVKKIRKVYETIPIIVLTVEERDTIVDSFMAAGATDYALKPIKAVDLISRIKVHLQYYERSRYYDNHSKGISKLTLQKIENCLSMTNDYVSAEYIEQNTDIKIKTVYRYMQYMVKNDKVVTKSSYQESGRPKVSYRLKE